MVKKVDAIETSKLLKKQDYDNIYKIDGKIPSITGLATTTTLTAVKNKIPTVNDI